MSGFTPLVSQNEIMVIAVTVKVLSCCSGPTHDTAAESVDVGLKAAALFSALPWFYFGP